MIMDAGGIEIVGMLLEMTVFFFPLFFFSITVYGKLA